MKTPNSPTAFEAGLESSGNAEPPLARRAPAAHLRIAGRSPKPGVAVVCVGQILDNCRDLIVEMFVNSNCERRNKAAKNRATTEGCKVWGWICSGQRPPFLPFFYSRTFFGHRGNFTKDKKSSEFFVAIFFGTSCFMQISRVQ